MDRRERPQKVCFVTIGATAAFDSLIKATLTPDFLQTIEKNGYTDLRLQYGKDGAAIVKESGACAALLAEKTSSLNVSGFDFNKEGVTNEMKAAETGVVISHAGSGSVLEALRLVVPLIVVPNPSLLDNHQVELAEEMAAHGYAVHGDLKKLPAALEEAERLRRKMQTWPSKNSRGDGRGLIGVMDDELGFVD